MARHRKMTNIHRTSIRGAAVGVAAIAGVALLAGPAGASDNDDTTCPEGSPVTCRVNNYGAVPGVPVLQVGELVQTQIKLLHCPGQVADIKARVLRQIDPVTDAATWAVKARVLVGQYCHTPPVVIVPTPLPAPLPEAPAPVIVTDDTATSPLPAVTH
jgi:hypothetical protein